MWIPQKGPQLAAIEADWCDEIFFGGERGGGKSDLQLGYQEDGALRYGKHSNGIMFRKTYPEMEELQSRAVEIFSASGAVFRTQPSGNYPFSNCWYWHNGATVKMRYIENEKDYGRYHGHQYTRISFDEVTEYPSPEGLLKMLSTLRSANGVPCSMRATGNPGGIGHVWVKARYIDPAPPFTPFTDPETGFTRMFIPSKLSDNQILVKNDPAYRNRILAATAGNDALRKAWTEGDWDIVAGAFFSCWSQKHIIAPVELPQHWVRFRSFDWGSARPFSVGWWAVSDGELPQFPRGAIIRYREWYGMASPNIGLKMPAESVAAGIKAREINDKISYGVADPAIFQQDGGPSIAEKMLPLVWRPADNKRTPGWNQLTSRLIGIDDRPMIYTFNTCVDSIRTIPAQQHDRNKIEDIDTDGEDHCFAPWTLVDTDKGSIPIDKVIPGYHMVWGNGGWRSVSASGMTRKNTPVLKLTFETGLEVICTGSHKFMDFSGEWRYAKDLLNREVLCNLEYSQRRNKGLTERFITYVATITKTKAIDYIETYGSGIMGLYQKPPISTTGTGIDHTTKVRTLNASQCKRTSETGVEQSQAKEVSTLLHWLKRRPQNGMVARMAVSGTPNIMRNISDQLLKARHQLYANFAGIATWFRRLKSNKESIAETNVKHVLCVSVEDWGRYDVYCITEPTTHTFTIEGGIVVHNCADEWRYACMSRPWVAPVQSEAKKKRRDYSPEAEDDEDSYRTV